MESMYHDMMLSYQPSTYPPQALPVSLTLAEYTLPTPPNSPLQITDLSGSLMGQTQMSDPGPTQSLAMDLSLTDHVEQNFSHLFEREIFEKDIFNEYPDILTNSFNTQSSFDTDIFDDYVPSPTPSPVYEHCTFVNPQESMPLNNYMHQVRPTPDSGGDDSDIDSSLSDDSFVVPHTNQRPDAFYTPVIHYNCGSLSDQERTHNYQIRTDPISIPDLTGERSGRVKKNRPTKHKKKCSISSSDDSDECEHKTRTKSTRGRGRREAMKGNHLWEFIRDLLKNKTTCPRIIRWENRKEGVFRFVNSEAVAGLWGTKKNNPKMNYEKLSRAMRYYYKREILERVDGRRLVYKFGCNADGWKEAAAELTEDE